MTEGTTGRAVPVRDRSGTAEALARPLDDELRVHGFPCWVNHEYAGGPCGRTAITMVYGLLFCDVHGAEATAGALADLYQDAADELGRLENPHLPTGNVVAVEAVRAAREEFQRREREHEAAEEAALRKAYPFDADKVCAETVAFDYRWDPDNPTYPDEWPTEI